jgi:cell shape-determining protein MreC
LDWSKLFKKGLKNKVDDYKKNDADHQLERMKMSEIIHNMQKEMTSLKEENTSLKN